MQTKIISVIVPVYNVMNYLKQCLDSIIQQTYTNLEIILVDDGSTDQSGSICDSYKELHGYGNQPHIFHIRYFPESPLKMYRNLPANSLQFF